MLLQLISINWLLKLLEKKIKVDLKSSLNNAIQQQAKFDFWKTKKQMYLGTNKKIYLISLDR